MIIQRVTLAASAMILMISTAARADNDQQAWEASNAKIAEMLRGLDKDYAKKYLVQLPAVPLYADWIDRYGMYSLYGIADNVTTWGPTWTPTADKFTEAYSIFLSAIKISNGAAGNTVLEQRWHAAGTALANKKNEARDAWLAFDTNQKKTKPKTSWRSRTDWYSEKYDGEIKGAKDKVATAYNAYRNTINPQELAYTRLFNQFENAGLIDVLLPLSAQTASADPNDPTSWATQPEYPFIVDTNAISTLVADGRAQVAAGTPLKTWMLDKNSETRDEERSNWSAGASYGFFISGRGGGSHHSIDLTQSGTYIKYSFYSIAMIPIRPAAWYSGTLLRTFACGPFQPPIAGTPPVTPSSLWGEHGTLSTIPVAVVVVYRPKIEAKLMTADYHFVQDEFHASGGVSIGPFSIGGGYSKLTQHIEEHDDTGTFIAETVSDTPTVLAVLYQKLGRTDCP